MGTCLSVCFGADGQQGSHPPPPPAGQTNNNAQPSSPLTYAAAVGATALHGVANKLEQHAGANGGTAPPSWTKPPASKPGKGVKFTIRNAHVFKMPDGDTFTVDHPDSSTGQKVTSRIRILGIDCPETAQNFGPEAGEIGRKMAFKQNVTLHVHTTDQYGRLVADVVLPNGKNYGEEMLRKGAAWHYNAYDKRQELADMENAARDAKIGLWAWARPQAPWEYRRKKRERQGK